MSVGSWRVGKKSYVEEEVRQFGVSELREMRQLRDQNARLKRLCPRVIPRLDNGVRPLRASSVRDAHLRRQFGAERLADRRIAHDSDRCNPRWCYRRHCGACGLLPRLQSPVSLTPATER